MGGRLADLPIRMEGATRIQVSKAQVQRYTWRSYESVTQRLQESLLLGVILAIGERSHGLLLAAERPSATENQHIRGATLAPRSRDRARQGLPVLPMTLRWQACNFSRNRNRSHPRVRRAGKRQGPWRSGVAPTRFARAGDRASLYDPSGEYDSVLPSRARMSCSNPLDARSPPWRFGAKSGRPTTTPSLAGPSSRITRS